MDGEVFLPDPSIVQAQEPRNAGSELQINVRTCSAEPTNLCNNIVLGCSSQGNPCGQELGHDSTLKLELHGNASILFAESAGKLVDIVLVEGIERRVEVFSIDGSIWLGSGWFVLINTGGAKPGDMVFFMVDTNGRFMARFYDKDGRERYPGVASDHICYVENSKRKLNRLRANCTSVVIGPGVILTSCGRKKIRDLSAARVGAPMYVCKLNHSCVRKGMMYFNREFSSAFAARVKTMVYIKMEGGAETTKAKLSIGSDGVVRICKGWQKFVHKHGLSVGDTCAMVIQQYYEAMALDVHKIGP